MTGTRIIAKEKAMKTRILAAATAATLALGAAAHAQSASMDQGFNMLTGAVYNALNAQGFDTSNINELSLADIALIRNLLSDEMGNNERQRIQQILDTAGE